MNAEQIQTLKQERIMILTWLDNRTAGNDGSKGDSGDQSKSTEDLIESRQSERVLKNRLAEIERALEAACLVGERCCLQCHQPIPPDRVEALPHTQYCVRCQVDQEHKAPRSSWRRQTQVYALPFAQ